MVETNAVVASARIGQVLQRRGGTTTAVLGVFVASLISNQTTAVGGQPRFEVASVRHVGPGERNPPFFVRVRGGRFEARSSLREVIRFAYEQTSLTRIVFKGDGPDRLDELFEIQARLPNESEPLVSDVAAMTRVMLAERFRLKLQLTTERRTLSVLRRLKPGVLGPNLRPFSGPCTPRPTGLRSSDPAFLEAAKTSCSLQVYSGRVRGTTESMAELARFLSLQLQSVTFSTEQVIIDGTDLSGRFQVEMNFDPATRVAGAVTSSDLPSFYDALRRQLGLNIEREARLVPMVVVQHAEMPQAN